MPTMGEYQKPAGVNKGCSAGCKCKACKPLGTRTMMSNNMNVIPTLRKIDNVPYKGNAVLNANK